MQTHKNRIETSGRRLVAAAVAPCVDQLEGRRMLTAFTRTSPTTQGLLPAGVTEVGGVVLDLVGTNGVRVVSQLAASALYKGYYDNGTPVAYRGNPLTIGIQTGFSAALINSLGGGIREAAVRITLYDGDTATGNFDEDENTLQVNGIAFGNFSDVVTQRTSPNGLTLLGTEPDGGFRNGQLDTGFFYSNNAALLASIYSSLVGTGQITYKLLDADLRDNTFDFTQGVDGTLIDVGTPRSPPRRSTSGATASRSPTTT